MLRGVEQWMRSVERVAERARHIHGLALQGDLAMRDPRDIEESADQMHEVPEVTVENRQLASQVSIAQLDEIHRSHHRGERVPQLVTEHREELILVRARQFRFPATALLCRKQPCALEYM